MPSCDDKPIWDLWLSSMWLPALTVAAELGVFEALQSGPATAPALANRLELRPRGCEILLRMLAALEVLGCKRDTEGTRYTMSEIARNFLRRESPHYWGHVWPSVHATNLMHGRLREALVVRKAKSGAADAGGEALVTAWETGQVDTVTAGRIARFMQSHSAAAAAGLARNGDFAGVTRILDVGGGSGCFSVALAQRHPGMRCTVMDLPTMCQVASEYIAEAAVTERVDTRSVDMFRDAWPRGYDGIFFSNVFHDWSFETCAGLAANAFTVLPGGGQILLHEMLLDESGTAPRTAAAFSILMLGGTRGQQFTFSELRSLLADAGFTDIRATPSYGYYSLVRGYKPPITHK